MESNAAHPSDTDGTSKPHHVVVVGGGFGGLFATRFLRRAPVHVTLVDRRQPPSLPAAPLSGGHRHPLRGAHRPAHPQRASPSAQRRGRARGGDRLRPGGAYGDRDATRWGALRDPLRQPDRRRRRRPVLLRPRRVLALGARDEDDRRRAGDPGADPRGVRDGGAGGGSGEAARMAHVRGRRGRPDWGGDRRPDRGALEAGPAQGLPHASTHTALACCCSTEARRSSPASAIASPRRRRRSWSALGWRYIQAASSRTSTVTGSR